MRGEEERVEVVSSARAGVCKMHCVSSEDEFQCITDRKSASISPRVVFPPQIVPLIWRISQPPSAV